MSLFSSSLFRIASLALLLPILGICDTYTASVTGTSLAFGQTNSGTSTTPITLGDGNTYTITTPYASSYDSGGTFISYFPTVTYTGGVALPSGFDAITVNYSQTFTGDGSFDGTYNETVPLVLGSQWITASGNLTVGTTALPVISFSGGPGSYTGTGSADVENLADGSVTELYSITYQFFAGAEPGASASSPATTTPEPAQMIPVGIGLIGFGLVALRRRRRQQV